MDKTKLVVKTIVMLGLIFAYNVIMYIIEPIVSPSITNDLAMLQMQNVEYSTTAIQAVTYAKNYSWVILVVIGLCLFGREIISIINLILEKDEKEN